MSNQQTTEFILRGFADGIKDAIEDMLNTETEKYGFTLLVYEYSKPGVAHYVSSAERGDMINMLQETLERLTKNQDMPAGIGMVN